MFSNQPIVTLFEIEFKEFLDCSECMLVKLAYLNQLFEIIKSFSKDIITVKLFPIAFKIWALVVSDNFHLFR